MLAYKTHTVGTFFQGALGFFLSKPKLFIMDLRSFEFFFEEYFCLEKNITLEESKLGKLGILDYA